MSVHQILQDYVGVLNDTLIKNNILTKAPNVLAIPFIGGALLKLKLNGNDLANQYLPAVNTLEEAMELANITLEKQDGRQLDFDMHRGMDSSTNGETIVLIKNNHDDQWTNSKAQSDAFSMKYNQPKKRILGYFWQ